MPAKSIVVAGAGGNIGSHLMRHVARMPEVERIVLIDRDTYEARNVVNQDIWPQDFEQPKALVQARRLTEIRSSLQVAAFHAPLESLPLGVWRASLILACLDSRAARQAVNERAWRLGVPWIDSGVMASESLARVKVYAPAGDAPCLECAWWEEDYRLIEQEYPCDGGARVPAPTGASSELGALAAALVAIECRKMLAGQTECAAIGRQVTFSARWHQLVTTAFRRNARCRFDHATWRMEPLPCDTGKMQMAELLTLARAIRVPGQRFVRRLVCAACHTQKLLFHLEGSLDAALRRCGRCRKPMVAAGFDIVESLDQELPADVSKLTLDQAGLRYGDVIQAGDRFLEIVTRAKSETD